MKTKMFHLKNQFLNWMISQRMYFTVSLLGCVEISWDENVPVAGIRYNKATKGFQMYLNPKVSEYSDVAKMFILLHELRHIPQVVDLASTFGCIAWGSKELSNETKMKVFNLAADIALNQDVSKLMATTFKLSSAEEAVAIMKKEVGGVFVEDLIAAAALKGINVLEGRDYVYYANKILELNPDLPNGHDNHDFGGGDGEGEGEGEGSGEAEVAASQALAKAADGAARLAREAGKEASDRVDSITSDQKTTSRIRSILKNIKVKAGVAGAVSYDTKKTWGRRNRKISTAPGRRKVEYPVPGVVLILDTSGSMYDENMLKALVAVGKELIDQKKLAGAFCCDTELHEMTIGHVTKVKGGGGTVLDNSHVNQIMEKFDVSKLAILYVTDEEVDLREIKSNPLVDLFIINLPEELRVKG